MSLRAEELLVRPEVSTLIPVLQRASSAFFTSCGAGHATFASEMYWLTARKLEMMPLIWTEQAILISCSSVSSMDAAWTPKARRRKAAKAESPSRLARCRLRINRSCVCGRQRANVDRRLQGQQGRHKLQ